MGVLLYPKAMARGLENYRQYYTPVRDVQVFGVDVLVNESARRDDTPTITKNGSAKLWRLHARLEASDE